MSDPHKDTAAHIWKLREKLFKAEIDCTRAGEHTHLASFRPLDCARCKANAAYDDVSAALAEAETEAEDWPDVIDE